MTTIDSARQKLTSTKFYVFLLLAYGVAVLTRWPDILIKRRFWAEEGEVYFHNAWSERWYDALFAVHSGYLNLSASIATLLAARLVPLEFAPLVSTGFALFVQLCPAILLVTGGIDWLRNRVTLALALLLLLACNNTGEVWLNSINSQHHLGLCAALILALPTLGGWLGVFRAALLVLAALSGPGSIFLTPLFFLRAWLDRSRARLMQAGLLAAFGVLQILMVALHPDPGREFGIGPRLLILVVYIKHLIEPLFGHGEAARIASRLIETVTSGGPVLPEITITLIAILAIVVTAWKTADPVIRWLLAGGTTIMAFSYFGSLAPHMGLLVVGGGGRYEYPPGVLFGLTLLGISQRSKGWVKAISTALVIWVIAIGMHDYFRANPFFGTGSTWTEEIRRWRADPSYRVQFWPVGGGAWRSQLGSPYLHAGEK